MRTRGNQLLIQILLMNMYSEAIGKAITQINAGF